MKDRESELPEICDGERTEHRWGKITSHACGYGPGDQVTDEALVIVTPVVLPGLGDICNDCFQIYGEPPGTRSLPLVTAYLALSAW